MKLKEKLAIEYCNSLGAPYTEVARGLIAEDFVAGFEKAKDMAIQIMKDTDYAVCRLRDLGEEEV